VFWISTRVALNVSPDTDPFTWTRMPMASALKLRVALPSTNCVDASVLTVRPAALKVSAGMVGGSDSTRPSSSADDPPVRTWLSISAEEPDTVTTRSMVWDGCTASRPTVALAPAPLN
jgi:hypothetical protein